MERQPSGARGGGGAPDSGGDHGDRRQPHAVIEAAGPWSSVQDLGRREGRRAGLAPGGAMDRRALLWANRLLGNAPGDAALEVALGGLTLRFGVDSTVALTGADCMARLDGGAADAWRTLKVRAGQRLRLGYSQTGMRAYLAFAGGLVAERAFGSASAVARDGLPGLLGRGFRTGEPLRWNDPERRLPVRFVPARLVPPAGDLPPLPLITGYEWERFAAADRERVFAVEWRVDPAGDRTAVRLAGHALDSGPRVLDSAPLVDGTVQVTGDGRPLIFMRDRPTIGGYAKIGAVDPIALDALAQARPGTPVRFERADPGALRRALLRRDEFFGLGERD